jgi:hypothetical protein
MGGREVGVRIRVQHDVVKTIPLINIIQSSQGFFYALHAHDQLIICLWKD